MMQDVESLSSKIANMFPRELKWHYLFTLRFFFFCNIEDMHTYVIINI